MSGAAGESATIVQLAALAAGQQETIQQQAKELAALRARVATLEGEREAARTAHATEMEALRSAAREELRAREAELTAAARQDAAALREEMSAAWRFDREERAQMLERVLSERRDAQESLSAQQRGMTDELRTLNSYFFEHFIFDARQEALEKREQSKRFEIVRCQHDGLVAAQMTEAGLVVGMAAALARADSDCARVKVLLNLTRQMVRPLPAAAYCRALACCAASITEVRVCIPSPRERADHVTFRVGSEAGGAMLTTLSRLPRLRVLHVVNSTSFFDACKEVLDHRAGLPSALDAEDAALAAAPFFPALEEVHVYEVGCNAHFLIGVARLLPSLRVIGVRQSDCDMAGVDPANLQRQCDPVAIRWRADGVPAANVDFNINNNNNVLWA